eukprot:SAG22_NODE_4438_length_1269_cov_1.059829_2_plen_153_part_01
MKLNNVDVPRALSAQCSVGLSAWHSPPPRCADPCSRASNLLCRGIAEGEPIGDCPTGPATAVAAAAPKSPLAPVAAVAFRRGPPRVGGLTPTAQFSASRSISSNAIASASALLWHKIHDQFQPPRRLYPMGRSQRSERVNGKYESIHDHLIAS